MMRWMLVLVVAVGGALGLLWWRSAADQPAPSRPLDPEVQRLLAQTRELLRDGLGERGLAEAERCLEQDPDCVEAQRHRVRALELTAGTAAASVELAALRQAYPADVGLVALEWQLQRTDASRELLADTYPELFPVHQEVIEQFEGDRPVALVGPWGVPRHLQQATTTRARELREVVSRTMERLDTATHEAWQAALRKSPELGGLRLLYAAALHYGRIRFPGAIGADTPPAYSGYTYDLAQQDYELILDQLALRSRLAMVAWYGLGDLALRMGDYGNARATLTRLLESRDLPSSWRSQIEFNLGVALYKDQRLKRAAHYLLESRATNQNIQTTWMLHLTGKEAFPFRSLPQQEPPSFRDVAPQLGIGKIDGAGPSAWGDVDGDGDFDLFVCGCDTFSALYRNDGGQFTNITQAAGLAQVASGFSATLIDYDNNGTLDLYIGRNGWVGGGPNSLYRNDGSGRFEDVTQTAGLGDDGSTFVHAWADFDRDGWLDVFLANGITEPGRNALYRNRGDGTFEDVTERSGLAEPHGTKSIGFAIGDYDRDGWPDLFIGGHETHNRLYRNRGDGTFEEVGEQAGIRVARDHKLAYVSFFADFDSDGWLDILATKQAPFPAVLRGQLATYQPSPAFTALTPRLFRNQQDGTFADVSAQAGFLYPHGVMGANVGDLDNDGRQDVYLATGGPEIHWLEMNACYLNQGDGTFIDQTRKSGLGHLGKGHGATFVDLDEDGDLDLYAPQGGFDCGDLWANAFYWNDLESPHHWLELDLVGVTSNRMGIGAQVTVRAGDLLLYQEHRGGVGFGSCSAPRLHFGLGTCTVVDELEVRWPSGEVSRWRQLTADRIVRAREGEPELDEVATASTSR